MLSSNKEDETKGWSNQLTEFDRIEITMSAYNGNWPDIDGIEDAVDDALIDGEGGARQTEKT